MTAELIRTPHHDSFASTYRSRACLAIAPRRVAGGGGTFWVPRAIASESRCNPECEYGDLISRCIFDGCAGTVLKLVYQVGCEGPGAFPLGFLESVVSCTIGGCPGAVAGIPFCSPDALGVLECAASLVLDCTGPYGKAAELAVQMALCAATAGDLVSGRRRRELEYTTTSFSSVSTLPIDQLSRRVVGTATAPLTSEEHLRRRRDYERDQAAELFYASSVRIANVVKLFEAIFGRGNATMASAYSPAFHRNQFVPAVLQGGPMGELFSQAELDSMLAANLSNVRAETVQHFAERWNNTVSAWSRG